MRRFLAFLASVTGIGLFAAVAISLYMRFAYGEALDNNALGICALGVVFCWASYAYLDTSDRDYR